MMGTQIGRASGRADRFSCPPQPEDLRGHAPGSAELKNKNDMTEFRYRCPDCGWEVNARIQSSDERDSCQPVICPSCQQFHSVHPAHGEVLGADELGDPW